MPRHVHVVISWPQAEAVAALGPVLLPKTLVVAPEPWHRAHLRKHGVACRDSVPYLGREAHIQGSRHIGTIKRLVESEFAPDLGDGLSATYTNRFTFFLLYRLRQLVRLALMLDGIRDKAPGAIWHIPVETPREGHTTRMLRLYAESHGIFTGPLAVREVAPERPQASESWPGLVRRLADRVTAGIYLSLLSRLGSSILYATPAMHMARLARDIARHHDRIMPVLMRYQRRHPLRELALALYWLLIGRPWPAGSSRRLTLPMPILDEGLPRSDERRRMEALSSAVSQFLARYQETLAFGGVPLGEIMLGEVDWLVEHLRTYAGPAQGFRLVLDHLKPSLVLAPSGGQLYGMLGELASQRGIPAIQIPFKSLSAPQDDTEAPGALQIGADMLTEAYPYTIAQSPRIADYATFAGYTGQVVASPPLLRTRVDASRRTELRDRLASGTGPFQQLVVYAPSMKVCPPLHVVHTLDEVLRCMADLVEATRSLPDTRLMIRLHPDLAHLAPRLPDLIDVAHHVILDTGTQDSFSDVLPMADLLVTNMSTVADEAIHNKLPVLLYDPWARHNHLGAPPITRNVPDALAPAHYLSRKDALATTLAWLLAEHPPGMALDESLYSSYRFPDATSKNWRALVDKFLP